MKTRREFLKVTTLGGFMLPLQDVFGADTSFANKPIVVSTWRNVKANTEAWSLLSKGGSSLDAVETGGRTVESDPTDTSVGYGGLPDRDGKVTLDACIMDAKGNCGSVAFVQGFMHPVSIARMVMEKTPHVMLVGEGAEKFALDNGFKKENMLTKEAEAAWKAWLKKSNYKPDATISTPGHDTIGLLALDKVGNLSGACTTSGMAYKMHGRVGDSPIIGAGLFVDGEVGAATATGVGEEMIRISGSHTIVELMRQGRTPQEACEEAVKRVIKKNGEKAKILDVAFLALSKEGVVGSYSTTNSFLYTLTTLEKNHVIVKSPSYFQ
jgi:N4-(beta-N-acetylglucosaminyl)-L-asparaginase